MWTLTSENGGNILLTFQSFDVQCQSCCGNDYMEVLYGHYSERLCGGENGDYLPGPFTSCGSSITLKFHSDNLETRPGFRAEWEELATSTPCCVPSTCDAANCLTYPADNYPCSNYPDNTNKVT